MEGFNNLFQSLSVEDVSHLKRGDVVYLERHLIHPGGGVTGKTKMVITKVESIMVDSKKELKFSLSAGFWATSLVTCDGVNPNLDIAISERDLESLVARIPLLTQLNAEAYQ